MSGDPSLEDLIGIQLCVGLSGLEPTSEEIQSLKRTRARSLVVFDRNFESPQQFLELQKKLKEVLNRELVLMVDHEGGRVIRFKNGVTRFPSAREQAALGFAAITQQGMVEAQELKTLGVRVNLAPCVDVVVDGSDPIIGDRSYGSDPEEVSGLGAARIHGLQGHGIAACAKHFPGLGCVPKDPHRVLPTIETSWEEMEEIHLAPFQKAIEEKVAMVMSSHVCYPGLGEPGDLPATFSRHLIHGLLRERFHFNGLILTDDLEMGALRQLGSMGELAIRATEAGHDLLLICSDLDAACQAAEKLRIAYQNGRLSVEDLRVTATRFEQTLGLH